MSSVKQPRIPSYCIHKGKNLAYVRLNGEFVYLGMANSPESHEKYHRAVAEWIQGGRVHVPPADRQGISVNEVLLAFRQNAETIHVDADGKPTTALGRINYALRPTMELYGTAPAAEFGPKALDAIRSKIVETGVKRATVNDRVDVIRQAFKWAASQELIPASVYHALETLSGLRRGRTAAPESEPVRPVAEHILTAVLKHCPPTLAAMIRLHNLTGMRSGELVIMRGVDIEFGTDGQPWFYRPVKHKTQNHGHKRSVPIGPAAQAVLRPFLSPDVQAYIFSPQRARDERNSAKRAARKTKVQPSQMNRRKAHPTRPPGERYTTPSYGRAILWATRLAIKAGDLPEGTHWHPHQLRHNAATRIRREFGLDTVRAVLGHSSVTQSAEYAELDATLATRAVAKLG